MTVKDLIEQLSTCDPSWTVVAQGMGANAWVITDVEVTELNEWPHSRAILLSSRIETASPSVQN